MHTYVHCRLTLPEQPGAALLTLGISTTPIHALRRPVAFRARVTTTTEKCTGRAHVSTRTFYDTCLNLGHLFNT